MAREQANLKIQDVARAFGIDAAHLIRIEEVDTNASISVPKRIARVLHVQWNDLVPSDKIGSWVLSTLTNQEAQALDGRNRYSRCGRSLPRHPQGVYARKHMRSARARSSQTGLVGARVFSQRIEMALVPFAELCKHRHDKSFLRPARVSTSSDAANDRSCGGFVQDRSHLPPLGKELGWARPMV